MAMRISVVYAFSAVTLPFGPPCSVPVPQIQVAVALRRAGIFAVNT